MTRHRQKRLFCGLLIALIITKNSCISAGLKPEKLGGHASQASFQQTMVAVAVTTMPIVQFPILLKTSLYLPLAMQTLCYCFGSGNPSHFSGTGMINVDCTYQTNNVHEIDLRDNDMQSLRGSMAFQISNRTNSFLDESTTMMLRLDQQSENS